MAGDYVPGEMNIDDQQATYTGFIAASVWGGTLVSLAVLLLTLVFAAGQPFMGSLFGVAFLGVVAGLMFRMGTPFGRQAQKQNSERDDLLGIPNLILMAPAFDPAWPSCSSPTVC